MIHHPNSLKNLTYRFPKKHGMAKTPTYLSWRAMRTRCLNKNSSDYGRYGGRGISICEEWNDFSVFFKDMGLRPDNKTLDRIDVNGNYSKENCRWATASEQQQNKTNCHYINIRGVKYTLSSFCREFGFYRCSVNRWLKKGLSYYEILEKRSL